MEYAELGVVLDRLGWGKVIRGNGVTLAEVLRAESHIGKLPGGASF
jgi:hypothetical protein